MKMRCLSFFVAALGMLCASCDNNDSGGSGTCSGDLGTTEAAQKVEAFVAASAALDASVTDLEGDLLAACQGMATDLGIPSSELTPMGSETQLQATCNRVAQEIEDIQASATVDVNVTYVAPECEVSVEAAADCYGECDVNVQPGVAEIECSGGELSGQCTAMCTGSCTFEAPQVQCNGQCAGTCSGQCMGSCNGECTGTCQQMDTEGKCVGTCSGTCNGTCSATCMGTCNAECTVEGAAAANCMGTCTGMCSVMFQEPTCTGELQPPMVDAQCRASCDAELNAEAECTEGQLTVAVSATVSTEEVQKLIDALHHHGPRLYSATAKLAFVGENIAAFGTTAQGALNSLGSAGLQIGACAVSTAAELAVLVPRVQASVEVSVTVTGSIEGGT